MAENEAAPKRNRREQLAEAVPGIVFAAGYLLSVPQGRDPLIVHILVAAFAGAVFTGVGLIALIVATHVVHSVAGSNTPRPDFGAAAVRRMMTGTLLLVACVHLNGLMQNRRAEKRLIRCVDNWERTRHYDSGPGQFATSAAGAIQACAREEGSPPYEE